MFKLHQSLFDFDHPLIFQWYLSQIPDIVLLKEEDGYVVALVAWYLAWRTWGPGCVCLSCWLEWKMEWCRCPPGGGSPPPGRTGSSHWVFTSANNQLSLHLVLPEKINLIYFVINCYTTFSGQLLEVCGCVGHSSNNIKSKCQIVTMNRFWWLSASPSLPTDCLSVLRQSESTGSWLI